MQHNMFFVDFLYRALALTSGEGPRPSPCPRPSPRPRPRGVLYQVAKSCFGKKWICWDSNPSRPKISPSQSDHLPFYQWDIKILISCTIINWILIGKIEKKYIQNSGFWSGISPDPHRPLGNFENPLGQHAVPSGIFKIPSAPGSGIWVKISSPKPELSI